MNFNQLRAIIKNIRTQVQCPSCNGSYSSEDLSVVSAVQNRCILVAQCVSCQLPILVTATLSSANASQEATDAGSIVTEHKLLKELRTEDIISTDDVLDMHQFLKGFQGDLGRVFNPAAKRNQE